MIIKVPGKVIGEWITEILLFKPHLGLVGITGLLFTEERHMPHYTGGIKAWRNIYTFKMRFAFASECRAETQTAQLWTGVTKQVLSRSDDTLKWLNDDYD